MRILLLIIFALMTVPAPTIVWAADQPNLNQIQSDIAARKAQENQLQSKLDKTEDELNDLRKNLVRAASDQKDSEDRLQTLQDRLDALQKQEAVQQEALAEQKTKMADVLTALLRISRTPPEIMLLRPDAPIDDLRSALLLRRTLPFFAEKAQKLSADLARLNDTRAAILDKQQAIMAAQKNYGEKQAKLNNLLGERQTWLKATESQRADVTRQIADLTAQAKNLQDLMNRVANAPVKFKNKSKQSGAMAGKAIFTAPAKGRILYNFADSDDVGASSRGITWKVKGGGMIVAPADGEVVFAGPFKGYGNILILRHSDDYHSFLAGFGSVDVAVGQTVNAGEPLGRAPAEGTAEGKNAQLYFELRYHGNPVDPMHYIRKTSVAQN